MKFSNLLTKNSLVAISSFSLMANSANASDYRHISDVKSQF